MYKISEVFIMIFNGWNKPQMGSIFLVLFIKDIKYDIT